MAINPTPDDTIHRKPPRAPPAKPRVETHFSIPPIAQSPPPPPLNSTDTTLRYDNKRQVYTERFPDPRAGSPINNRVVEPLDLDAYMAKAGNLGNPDYFDTAELLMTTGLTNAGRDAHLKSRLYVGQTPWINNKKLIADIDTLPHGPIWGIFIIDLNEPMQRTSRNPLSYLFMRPIVDVACDLLANPDFKDYMQYVARRDWTAEDRRCRVYGETCSGNWWWNLQVSIGLAY
ncbi:hypothetical protein FRC12_024060 [Ceratobasidium sp. 428]|nr:hypothetical protein FRC12_024060 [Ceratobasidium sp. 428]